MFSFRSDKTGFFSGVVLMTVAGGTVLATILILILGGWEDYKTLLKWLWGSAWVVCIVTVLIRVAIFRFQMQRIEQRKENSSGDSESPVNTSTAERQEESSREKQPGT